MLSRKRSAWAVGAMALVLLSVASATANAQTTNPTTTSAPTTRPATCKEVNDAIEKAKAFLLAQEKDGNWEHVLGASYGERNPGGMTALAIYALLAAGTDPKDQHIQDAINYLLKTPTSGTYTLAARGMVWLSLPDKMRERTEIQKAIDHDAKLLMQGGPDSHIKDGPSMFYTYTCPCPSGFGDHSNSQMAVLGMWAYTQCAFETPDKYWQAVDHGWRSHQFNTGGWSYQVAGPIPPNVPPLPEYKGAGDYTGPRISMTMAGIATLFITDDYLRGMEGIDCKGNIVDANIDAGLKWVGEHFKEVYFSNYPYNFYSASRIGVASGRKYFGGIDWFKDISTHLVKTQLSDGAWGWSVERTSFCLLFMARGRAPVVMNKLQYELSMHGDKKRDANWNERPRDAANVTHWIGKQNEQPILNWQVVDLKAPVEDLHDAPILYIAGNQPIDLSDADEAKLKQFVEEGGLIFANADCANRVFTVGIKKICKKLFPYEFRDLPVTSPIFTNQQFARSKWRHTLHVEALSNGVRELVILVPDQDPAQFWQTSAFGGHEEGAQFIDDVFLYTLTRAADGGVGLVYKGDTYIVKPDPNVHPDKTIKVARLQYPGPWDPEPYAWHQLAAVMHNTNSVDLDVQNVNLGDNKLDQSFKVAALTGAFKFSIPQAGCDELKKYVEGGGTLIVDVCGGDAGVAAATQKELATIFPDQNLSATPLGLDNAVFALGPKLERVRYRRTAMKVVGSLHTPRICTIDIKGRPAVFFSAEDMTAGMVGMQTDGIYGYEPASAIALMEKLVLFASKP